MCVPVAQSNNEAHCERDYSKACSISSAFSISLLLYMQTQTRTHTNTHSFYRFLSNNNGIPVQRLKDFLIAVFQKQFSRGSAQEVTTKGQRLRHKRDLNCVAFLKGSLSACVPSAFFFSFNPTFWHQKTGFALLRWQGVLSLSAVWGLVPSQETERGEGTDGGGKRSTAADPDPEPHCVIRNTISTQGHTRRSFDKHFYYQDPKYETHSNYLWVKKK